MVSDTGGAPLFNILFLILGIEISVIVVSADAVLFLLLSESVIMLAVSAVCEKAIAENSRVHKREKTKRFTEFSI